MRRLRLCPAAAPVGSELAANLLRVSFHEGPAHVPGQGATHVSSFDSPRTVASSRHGGRFPALVTTARPKQARLDLAIIGTGGRGKNCNMTAMAARLSSPCATSTITELGPAAMQFPQAEAYTDLRARRQEASGRRRSCRRPTRRRRGDVRALHRGLHIYCEKPLTHWIGEAQAVTKAAAEAIAPHSNGHRSQSNERRFVVEIIRSARDRPIEEVHIWSNRRFGRKGHGVPTTRPRAQEPRLGVLGWAPHVGSDQVHSPGRFLSPVRLAQLQWGFRRRGAGRYGRTP